MKIIKIYLFKCIISTCTTYLPTKTQNSFDFLSKFFVFCCIVPSALWSLFKFYKCYQFYLHIVKKMCIDETYQIETVKTKPKWKRPKKLTFMILHIEEQKYLSLYSDCKQNYMFRPFQFQWTITKWGVTQLKCDINVTESQLSKLWCANYILLKKSSFNRVRVFTNSPAWNN